MNVTENSAKPEYLTDAQLVLRYCETSDSEIFAELVRRYERELYGFLRRYLGDATLAEDVFQATFLQLHLKCHQFKSGFQLRPWLFRIATNQAIDAVRRNRRHRLPSLDAAGTAAEHESVRGLAGRLSPAPSPDDHLEQEDLRRNVRSAVDQLPDPLQQIVTLVFFQGLKYREAAEQLAIPLGTLKSRMHTALKMLNTECSAQLLPTV